MFLVVKDFAQLINFIVDCSCTFGKVVVLVENLFKSNFVFSKLNIVVRPFSLMLIILPLLRVKNFSLSN